MNFLKSIAKVYPWNVDRSKVVEGMVNIGLGVFLIGLGVGMVQAGQGLSNLSDASTANTGGVVGDLKVGNGFKHQV